MCQLKFEIQLNPVRCNASMLDATWTRLKLQEIHNRPEALFFHVQIILNENNGSTATFSAPFNRGS